MNKIFNISIALLFVMASFVADNKKSAYIVNNNSSQIEWLGKKLTGEHKGTIALKSGELIMEGKNIVGGLFVMDMKRIKVTDIAETDPQNQKLVKHLENKDFFDVENYPEAKFKVTKATKKSEGVFAITGDLTIKDKTNPITFESTITGQTKNTVITRADIKIDRTKWGILFKSSAFGEAVIYDEFELSLKLAAVK